MKTLLTAMVLLAAATALGQQNAAVWCVGESTKVKPGDALQASNLVWNGGSRTVTLGGARNEYVAFQIAVHAGPAELKAVTVEVGDLTGPGGAVISKANIDLLVEHYLNVKVSSRGDADHLVPGCTPGEHPTQMVPFNAKKFGAPFDVGAQRNQPVWVDVYVPEDAKPGHYAGQLKVKAGDQEVAPINVALDVWNFTLPNETHFLTWIYTGPENLKWAHRMPNDMSDPAWAALEDQYFQMAHQHRFNFHPMGGDGREEVFSRYWKYYDGSGFTQRAGKGVGQNLAGFSAPEQEQAMKDWCRQLVAQIDAKKLTAMPMVYIWDEPHSAEDFAQSKQRCKWVHDAVGKKLYTMVATPQYSKYDAGDVNIFTEPDVADIAKVVARGDTVWSVNAAYTSGPYVDSPGYGARSIPWMAWKLDLAGWQFWDCCYWVDKQNRKHKQGNRWVADFTTAQVNADPGKYLTDLWNDSLNFDESRKKGYPVGDSIRINGDGLLFYPGHDIGIEGPIASYAMKSFRRGAQDYEYLWMLKKEGKSAQIKPIVDRVCPAPSKWAEDPEAWDKARLELAKLLNKP